MTTRADRIHQVQRQKTRLLLMVESIRQGDESPGMKEVLLEGVAIELANLEAQLASLVDVDAVLTHVSPLRIAATNANSPINYKSAQLVPQLVGGLRMGVQSIAGFLETGEVPTRPTNELKRAADFSVDRVAAGSVVVALSPAPPSGHETLDENVERALSLLIDAIEWAGSEGSDEELSDAIQAADLRAVVLEQLERLTPSARGAYTHLGISGTRVTSHRGVRFSPSTRQFVRAAAERLLEPRLEVHRGVLRSVDLDAFWCTVKTDGGMLIRCEFRSALLDQVQELFHQQVPVEVSGVRQIINGRYVRRLPIESIDMV